MEFGLKDDTLEKIRKVFSKYEEVEKVLIYGSRAKGNYKPGSDIDLTFIGEGLNRRTLNRIDDDIDDLLLPYSFDLSILKEVTNTDFLAHVNRVASVFYERKTMAQPLYSESPVIN